MSLEPGARQLDSAGGMLYSAQSASTLVSSTKQTYTEGKGYHQGLLFKMSLIIMI